MDEEALERAIEFFRRAVDEDSGFHLAHYRLGLALRANRQPSAAEAVLRLSLRGGSGASHVALAQTLYSHDRFRENAPQGLQQSSRNDEAAKRSRVAEAQRLWQRVAVGSAESVDWTSRASAFSGLCMLEATGVAGEHKARRLRAYYYCQRALSLHAIFGFATESAASNLDNLGAVVLQMNAKRHTVQTAEWHCSWNAIVEVDAGGSGRVEKQVRLLSAPYASVAAVYFRRALALQPDNPTTRCNLATAELVLERGGRMKELEEDPKAQVFRAEKLLIRARGTKDRALSASFYRLALQGYEMALRLAPTHTEALNAYAYTFWRWRALAPDLKPPLGPDAEIARRAEAYARLADRLAAPTAVMMRATLGEVLLGLGRSEEAVEVLERLTALPKASHFNWIRWDLAQAYLCASKSVPSLSEVGDNRAPRAGNASPARLGVPAEGDSIPNRHPTTKAAALLEEIREFERGREDQVFTSSAWALDPTRVHPACAPESAPVPKPTNAGPLFAQSEPARHEQSTPCGVVQVLAHVLDSDAPRILLELQYDLQLHVWGGGADGRVAINRISGFSAAALLSPTPRGTHNYYYAQLEALDGGPVSLPIPVPTLAGACPNNRITVTFNRITPPLAIRRLFIEPR